MRYFVSLPQNFVLTEFQKFALKIFLMKKKEKKEPTKFYNLCVQAFFDFFEKKFGFRPSFDGSAPRDLKSIVDSLKSRSEEKDYEWTPQLATAMLTKFLEFGYQDLWLKENFLLQNLNRQKDKIFIRIKNHNNGNSKSGFTRDGVMAELERRYSDHGQSQPE